MTGKITFLFEILVFILLVISKQYKKNWTE